MFWRQSQKNPTPDQLKPACKINLCCVFKGALMMDPNGPPGPQDTPISLLNRRKPVPTPRSTLRKPKKDDIMTALENIPGVGSLRSLDGCQPPMADHDLVKSKTLGPRKAGNNVSGGQSSCTLGFPKVINQFFEQNRLNLLVGSGTAIYWSLSRSHVQDRTQDQVANRVCFLT